MVSEEVVYVGYTSDQKSRLYNHRRKWSDIEAMVVLEEVGPQWRDRKHYWIQHYRGTGAPLRNKTVGRNGQEQLSDETRAKLSAVRTGRPRPPTSDETRAKMRAAKLGTKQAPEHRAKIAEGNRGRVMSEENKAKLRLANLGKKQSAETLAKLSAIRTGRKRSDEHRAKISAAQMGRPSPPKTLDGLRRLSEAHKGRIVGPMSDEHKQKIKAARLQGEANRRAARLLEAEQGITA